MVHANGIGLDEVNETQLLLFQHKKNNIGVEFSSLSLSHFPFSPLHCHSPWLIGYIWHVGFFESSPRNHCKEPIWSTVHLQSESFTSWKSLNQSCSSHKEQTNRLDADCMAAFNFCVNVSHTLHVGGRVANGNLTCWTSSLGGRSKTTGKSTSVWVLSSAVLFT